MSDSSEIDEKSSRASKIWLGLFLILPLIYFLSIGPASIAYDNTTSTQLQTALQTIYYPLGMLHEKVPAVRPVMEAYMDLWE